MALCVDNVNKDVCPKVLRLRLTIKEHVLYFAQSRNICDSICVYAMNVVVLLRLDGAIGSALEVKVCRVELVQYHCNLVELRYNDSYGIGVATEILNGRSLAYRLINIFIRS